MLIRRDLAAEREDAGEAEWHRNDERGRGGCLGQRFGELRERRQIRCAAAELRRERRGEHAELFEIGEVLLRVSIRLAGLALRERLSELLHAVNQAPWIHDVC